MTASVSRTQASINSFIFSPHPLFSCRRREILSFRLGNLRRILLGHIAVNRAFAVQAHALRTEDLELCSVGKLRSFNKSGIGVGGCANGFAAGNLEDDGVALIQGVAGSGEGVGEGF